MSPRELRLRERIDRLQDENAALRAVIEKLDAELERRFRGMRPCSNCGANCRGEMCGECRRFFRPYQQPCRDCGKTCKGTRCAECHVIARTRRQCDDCGRDCRGRRCRECHMLSSSVAA